MGLDDLRRGLFTLAHSIPPRNPEFVTRLPLDRAFTVKGYGTVATGTLIAGSITAGKELAIEPGGRTAKVRGLQMHGQAVPTARAATRLALNLARVEPSSLRRGDTLVDLGTLTAVDTIDVEILLLPGASALKHRARVHFHAFSTECIAATSLYGCGSLEPGASGLARLRLSRSVVLTSGDRFVLRHGTPIATIGGGRVLDAHPFPRVKRLIAHQWLRNLSHTPPAEQIEMRIQRRGSKGMSLSALVAETGFRPENIRALLAPALESQMVIALQSDVVAAADALREASDAVSREFELLSRDGAGSGVKRSALRSRLRLQQEVFDYIVQSLEDDGKLRITGELLTAAADVPVQSREHEKLVAIRRAYDEAGLAPPSTGEIAGLLKMDAAETRRLITLLLRDGTLVRLGDDSLCMHRRALDVLTDRMRSLRGHTLDIATFKQLTGISRKYAIPLLEYLDRQRVTAKQGSQRLVL